MFGKKKGTAGLDVGSSAVKVVELSGKINNLSLSGLGFESLPPETIVDGQIMELNTVSEAIQIVFRDQQINADRVIAGVSGHSVILKNIVVPSMTHEELEESIDWHAEEHIPYDLADVSLDFHVTNESAEAIHVLIAACKRERIDNLKQVIQLAGKQPIVVDVDTFALQNCYEVNYQPDNAQVVALLNIGASTMNINIVRGNQSVFTRDMTSGGSQFTDVLQRGLGISFQDAEAVKRGMPAPEQADEKGVKPLIGNVMEMIALEIQKTMDFYRATTDDGGFDVQKILISGGGSKLANLPEELSSRLELPVEVLNPFQRIKVDSRKFDPEYLNEIMPEMAVAVGLALRGVDAR
ncbi:MAG: type IV pilus assembly protein PilM [Pyrinomonadaceae bacterium]|nr:type IV pilus assembly protein PilM [Pyrinomonadaceae bacterium]